MACLGLGHCWEPSFPERAADAGRVTDGSAAATVQGKESLRGIGEGRVSGLPKRQKKRPKGAIKT